MAKAISIDPGFFKCGLVIVDITKKKVCEAEVIRSIYILSRIKKIYKKENNIKCLIGNGTSSQKYVNDLNKFIPNLIVVDESDSTFRAKQRYFEIFPLKGLQFLLPKEIFILNKNLDALAALIIMEDYYKCKFEINESINIKTWLK